MVADIVLWKQPLGIIGWMIAHNLRRKGVKGIERPIDFEKLKHIIKQKLG